MIPSSSAFAAMDAVDAMDAVERFRKYLLGQDSDTDLE
jgi:hypothetical protein